MLTENNFFFKIDANDIENLIYFRENPCNYDKEKGPIVLCAIITVSASHTTKMKAIHETWAKRLVYYFFLLIK